MPTTFTEKKDNLLAGIFLALTAVAAPFALAKIGSFMFLTYLIYVTSGFRLSNFNGPFTLEYFVLPLFVIASLYLIPITYFKRNSQAERKSSLYTKYFVSVSLISLASFMLFNVTVGTKNTSKISNFVKPQVSEMSFLPGDWNLLVNDQRFTARFSPFEETVLSEDLKGTLTITDPTTNAIVSTGTYSAMIHAPWGVLTEEATTWDRRIFVTLQTSATSTTQLVTEGPGLTGMPANEFILITNRNYIIDPKTGQKQSAPVVRYTFSK